MGANAKFSPPLKPPLPTKMAELIEMPFGLWSLVGLKNHVLDGDPDPPCKWTGLMIKGRPTV